MALVDIYPNMPVKTYSIMNDVNIYCWKFNWRLYDESGLHEIIDFSVFDESTKKELGETIIDEYLNWLTISFGGNVVKSFCDVNTRTCMLVASELIRHDAPNMLTMYQVKGVRYTVELEPIAFDSVEDVDPAPPVDIL
jgi:hypothetical protein